MVTDKEHDLEILKQRLPPRLREKFDTIFVDKKELDAPKKIQTKRQRRTRSQQSQQPEE